MAPRRGLLPNSPTMTTSVVIVPRRPAEPSRCLAHPTYFLASCDECRAAQAVRIARVREIVATA